MFSRNGPILGVTERAVTCGSQNSINNHFSHQDLGSTCTNTMNQNDVEEFSNLIKV